MKPFFERKKPAAKSQPYKAWDAFEESDESEMDMAIIAEGMVGRLVKIGADTRPPET